VGFVGIALDHQQQVSLLDIGDHGG
jgi:hypothetical protein